MTLAQCSMYLNSFSESQAKWFTWMAYRSSVYVHFSAHMES